MYETSWLEIDSLWFACLSDALSIRQEAELFKVDFQKKAGPFGARLDFRHCTL